MPFIGALIGGVASGVGSIIGGGEQADAARSASNAQIQANRDSIDFQKGVLQQIQQQLAPYLNTGTNALSVLGGLYGITNGSQAGPPGNGPGGVPQLIQVLQQAQANGTDPNTAIQQALGYGWSQGDIQSAISQAPGLGSYIPSQGSNLGAFNIPITDQLAGQGIKPPTVPTIPGAPNPNDPALRAAFTASPGYQYQLDQANQAITNSGAAKTGALSGNTLRALQTNATGLASQDWWNNYNNVVGNWLNNVNAGQQTFQNQSGQYTDQYNMALQQRQNVTNALQNLISGGQSAAAGQGSAGIALGQSIGNTLTNSGGARAAGILGASNANASMFNSIGNSLSQLFGQGGTGAGAGGNFLGGNFTDYLQNLFGGGSSFSNPFNSNYTGGIY